MTILAVMGDEGDVALVTHLLSHIGRQVRIVATVAAAHRPLVGRSRSAVILATVVAGIGRG